MPVTERTEERAQHYDVLFAQGALREATAFYRWVLRALDAPPGARLLDVACGQGLLLAEAQRHGLMAHGVDFAHEAVEASRRAAPGAAVLLANGERLPYDDASFDCVACLGSLEHYEDPWQGAREIRRVLRPGGRAAIVLPNAYYLADILWHVWRTGRGPSHKQDLERFAIIREWGDLLAMMGLAPRRVRPYNFLWPRSLADWRWYLRRPRKLLYLLSGLVTPRNLSCQFLYLCEVAEPRPELNARLPFALRRPAAWR